MASTRILVVHGEGSYIDRLREGLGGDPLDYEVMTALSAPRAIGTATSKQPDAIVIDAEMDDVDGYELAAQMKGDPALTDIPLVFVSKMVSESARMKARQAGAAAHINEDLDVSMVHETIQRVLGKETTAVPAVVEPPATGAEASGIGPDTIPAPDAVVEPAGVQPEPVPAVVQPETEAAAVAPPSQPEVPADQSPSQPEQPPAESMGDGVPQPLEGYGAPQPVGDVEVPVSQTTAPSGTLGREGLSGERRSTDTPNVDDLLRLMIERGGSDLHITVGSPPGLRLRGDIVAIENTKTLTPRDVMEMILNLLSEEQRRKFETELELDFAYSIPGVSRFRANVFQQRNSMAAVFRVIPLHIPTLDELQLPQVCRFLAERPRGLVLVTGPTGSGKSTTQAAMINHINSNRALHIITMEDPIEFLHQNKKAYVNQREVGEDTHSFSAALKRVLRQDPDVILVGEMRDLETISAAITAAETGHLVLATLHTTGGPETIDRIIDVFPPHQQQQVRMQLSNTLEGVLSQVLLRSTDGKSRMLAMEIMLGTAAIRNLIREGKTHQMPTIIQGGASVGMQTLDQHLKLLLQNGRITYEDAIGKAQNPKELAQMLGRKL